MYFFVQRYIPIILTRSKRLNNEVGFVRRSVVVLEISSNNLKTTAVTLNMTVTCVKPTTKNAMLRAESNELNKGRKRRLRIRSKYATTKVWWLSGRLSEPPFFNGRRAWQFEIIGPGILLVVVPRLAIA